VRLLKIYTLASCCLKWSAKLSLVKVKLALTYVIILLTDFSFIFAKMILGINLCGALTDEAERPDNLIMGYFNLLAIKYPEHNFVFITDIVFENAAANVKNTSIIRIDPRPKNIFFWKFWYDRKLEKIVKKKQIDLLISLDEVCSLRSEIPQLLLINNLPAYKRGARQFLQKAKRIAVTSNFLKKRIIDRYKLAEEKIDIIYQGIDRRYVPLSFEEKERTKQKYTEGKEYFLYAGDIDPDKNLINLLKAFSFFKKRQKSNMQLVIISNKLSGSEFQDSLKTYKYREEVKLLHNLPFKEQTKIMASAYAFVSPSLQENFPDKIIAAMQCEVPAIANNMNMEVITEICGNSVLYTNANNFEEIADKMMLLFKDENKRNEFIAKGRKQALQYSADKTADLLWQSIIKTTPA
jgi:glycosyltransferase involved in cell wall biosynthesis